MEIQSLEAFVEDNHIPEENIPFYQAIYDGNIQDMERLRMKCNPRHLPQRCPQLEELASYNGGHLRMIQHVRDLYRNVTYDGSPCDEKNVFHPKFGFATTFALCAAIQHGNLEIVKYLVQQDNNNFAIRCAVAECYDERISEYLLPFITDWGNFFLRACYVNNPKMIRKAYYRMICQPDEIDIYGDYTRFNLKLKNRIQEVTNMGIEYILRDHGPEPKVICSILFLINQIHNQGNDARFIKMNYCLLPHAQEIVKHGLDPHALLDNETFFWQNDLALFVKQSQYLLNSDELPRDLIYLVHDYL